MKKLKLKLHLLIFFALVLLLPLLLFITAGQDNMPLPVCSNEESALKVIEPVKINYAAIIFLEVDKKALPLPEAKSVDESIAEAEPQEKVAEEKLPASSASVSETAETGSLLSQKEQQMVSLINEARINAGLPTLKVNSQLVSAARAKSKDMVNNNYFSHQSPVYGDLEGLLRRFGITYRAAGENLAMNSNGSVSAAYHSLMGSSGHRANILNNRYNQVGVGIHTKSDGTHYYTQLFIGF